MIEVGPLVFFGIGLVAGLVVKLTWWMARVEYWSRRAKNREKQLAALVLQQYEKTTLAMLDDAIARGRKMGITGHWWNR